MFFCLIVLLTQKNNILELDQWMKSGKMSGINYTGIESLIRKIDNCKNNPQKFSATKIGKNIL